MKKIDWNSYLKIILIPLMLVPLEIAYWLLDFNLKQAILFVSILHIILAFFGILLFNYLETGNWFEFSKNVDYKQNNKNKL